MLGVVGSFLLHIDQESLSLVHGEAYANGLKGSNGLEIIAGAGHAAHLEEPEKVAGLIGDFLS